MFDHIEFYEDNSKKDLISLYEENANVWKNKNYNIETFMNVLDKGDPVKVLDQLNHCVFFRGYGNWKNISKNNYQSNENAHKLTLKLFYNKG